MSRGLIYWAVPTVLDRRDPLEKSTWTLWFGFREPPMQHLTRAHQDGVVAFFAEAAAPHFLMVSGFVFDLFIEPIGLIARPRILAPAAAL